MKKNRQEAITALMQKEVISTQEELMLRLREMGFNVTQATVSRDIKSLGLIKTAIGDGRYKYSLVNNGQEKSDSSYRSILTHSVISTDYAENMAVLKCCAGMANAACATLDRYMGDMIVGTIAGDDTIFVLMRSREEAAEFVAMIEEIIK